MEDELLPELSDAQREIMELVWDQGEMSARDVRLALASRRPLARNTVRTLMERMEQKGWLSHRVEGRTYLYRAARPREQSLAQQVGRVLDQVCGGSPETLVSALLDYRGLTRGELTRVRAMLDRAKRENRP